MALSGPRSSPLLVRLLFVIIALTGSARPSAATARGAQSHPAVRGIVTDPSGAAVPAARVSLETPVGIMASTTTDASGLFDVAAPAAGAFTLRISAPGLAADPFELLLRSGESREVAVTLRLSAVTDTIVVSAGHVEAPLSATPGTVTVFSSDDIAARQTDSIADLLRVTPGMTVAQSGGRGALTSVFPRGGESDYTLVLVDGMRLNSMGGGFDFALLPVAGLDRVEVVRGPHSALFGADAIGGVVQVVTRSGGPAWTAGLLEGGSFGTVRGTASAAGAVGRWGWGASTERGATDGYEGLSDAGEPVTNDDGTHGQVMGSVRYTAPGWTAGGHVRFATTERGFPGPYGSDPNGTFPAVDPVSRGWTDHLTTGAAGSVVFSPQWRARGDVSHARLDGRFRSPFDTSITETRRTAGRAQVDGVVGQRLGFTAGVEVLGELARSTYITGLTPSPLPVRRRVTGSFAEGRFELPNRLTASAGLRVEHIRRESLEANESPFSPRPPFGRDVVVSANPRVAVSWFVRSASPGWVSWTRVRANAGTGIRPPDAFEIAFTDNPALAPERSRSYDVGVEQALADARVVLDATWFSNRYDDLIVAVGRAYQDASRYRTDNIANARARGLELSAALRPGRWLHVRTGYTWLDSAVLAVDGTSGAAPSPFAPGDALIRRPRHQGWVDATITGSRTSAFARFGARGRVLDVDPSLGAFGGTVEGTGYAIVDAGASFRVWRQVAVFGRITNLLDRDYEEALGFPSPGRAVMGGVRVAAGR